MEYKNFPQIKTWSKQAQIGAIHIVRTHQGVAKSYTPYKKYHFSYTKCVLGEGGGGGIFDFVHTYYVNYPIE